MNIKLKKKKLKSGKYSWYIETYLGHTTNNEGKIKHNRKFEYLKVYSWIEPQNAEEKKESLENEKLAKKIFKIREAEIIQGKFEIPNPYKSKILLLDYFQKVVDEKEESTKKGNWSVWKSCQKHLEEFTPNGTKLADVDVNFVKGFKNHILNHSYTKSNIKLKSNSQHSYFAKFRAAIRQAYDDGLIKINPCKSVKQIKAVNPQREYLTINELRALANTELKYPVLKEAFLFGCLSGMRWSDINKLKWRDVHDEPQGSRIIFRQSKTKGQQYLDINKEARNYLGKRGNPEERVFIGLKYSSAISNELLRWCMRAGITKHITFHCARHTNAVLLLENGADLYTVSKRLGHKWIKTTEIYAKIIDRKMKEAAECLPTLNI